MTQPDTITSLLYLLIFIAAFTGILGVAAGVAEWLQRRKRSNKRLL
jgi:hypothetical protein